MALISVPLFNHHKPTTDENSRSNIPPFMLRFIYTCAIIYGHGCQVTTDKNGVQCASTGIGRGANNAAMNREAAEKNARESKSGEGRVNVGRGSGEAKCDRPRGRNSK